MEHSKYYYDYTRNMKEDKIDYSKEKSPSYYIGRYLGIQAKDVCFDFDLTYNIGTAVTYLLRSGKKQERGMNPKAKRMEDIRKAINHLEFELTNIEREGGQ